MNKHSLCPGSLIKVSGYKYVFDDVGAFPGHLDGEHVCTLNGGELVLVVAVVSDDNFVGTKAFVVSDNVMGWVWAYERDTIMV